MEWVELVAPSAAILALFLAIGLIVQSIRHGRAMRRVEERLAQNGSAAVEASLERVRQLQARADISSGDGRRLPPNSLRTALIGVGVLVGVGLVGAAGWFFLLRDNGDPDAQAAGDPLAVITGTGTTPTTTAPADPGTVPDDPPPVDSPATFAVAVFNAGGVTGAAGRQADLLDVEGWNVLAPDFVTDDPNGVNDLARSVVQYTDGNQAAADAVAEDLDIESASPLDGYTEEQIGGADVLVLVGQDVPES